MPLQRELSPLPSSLSPLMTGILPKLWGGLSRIVQVDQEGGGGGIDEFQKHLGLLVSYLLF